MNDYFTDAIWKGAYNIRVDPTVEPATHARRKVPMSQRRQ